jgi:phenylpropionate dioxygenase-like ring-hydroxylating dioxygenase large terminal subunit
MQTAAHTQKAPDDGAYRYPFPPYPRGWFFVAESADVGAGEVRPLRYFGRDLVLYRTGSGRAVVVDAHCPHMGAHVGYGGQVEGDSIRCPFHHWRFAAEGGRVVDVPYARGLVPDVGLSCWPVHETSGLVLVHHGGEPTWWMPDRWEWGADGWLGYQSACWRVRMHVQELAENIPDTTHFLYVHGVPTLPVAEVETDGHVYRQKTIGRLDDGTETWRTEQEAFGLGLVWLSTPGNPVTFLTATTPVDEESVELRLLFLVHEGPGATGLSPASKAALDALCENVARDVPIWEHKVYRDRPPLVAGDGPIGVLRKWARQFY